MTIDHLEVLVEEPSMEAALRVLMPRMVGETSFEIYTHQCKDDLLQKLPDRLRGYAKWLPETCGIVVLIDRDDDDCKELKRRIDTMAIAADLSTRSAPRAQRVTVVNRLAIEELEAWYFGDWPAVRSAYPRVPITIPSQAKYRRADEVAGGTWEAFEKVLKASGYFKTGLRKIEAARSIATHMAPDRNASPSFRALHQALRELCQT